MQTFTFTIDAEIAPSRARGSNSAGEAGERAGAECLTAFGTGEERIREAMANPFRDMSVIMQGLVALAIAVVLVLVGLYVPVSPVAQERDCCTIRRCRTRTKLNQEVTQLQVYKQRYGELKQQMDALSKQLDTLKTIVPEEKEVDEFIRLGAGSGERFERATAAG